MKLVYLLEVSPAGGTVQVNESYISDSGQVWMSLLTYLSYSSSSRAFSEFQSCWRTNVGTMPTSDLLILKRESIATIKQYWKEYSARILALLTVYWQYLIFMLPVKLSSPRLDDPDAIEILSELISNAGNRKMNKIKSPNRWWFGVFEHESWFSLFCCSDDPTEHDVDG